MIKQTNKCQKDNVQYLFFLHAPTTHQFYIPYNHQSKDEHYISSFKINVTSELLKYIRSKLNTLGKNVLLTRKGAGDTCF